MDASQGAPPPAEGQGKVTKVCSLSRAAHAI
jgi:hypothetical protein